MHRQKEWAIRTCRRTTAGDADRFSRPAATQGRRLSRALAVLYRHHIFLWPCHHWCCRLRIRHQQLHNGQVKLIVSTRCGPYPRRCRDCGRNNPAGAAQDGLVSSTGCNAIARRLYPSYVAALTGGNPAAINFHHFSPCLWEKTAPTTPLLDHHNESSRFCI